MEGDRFDELNLPLMVADSGNGESMGTAFTVTVDAKRGTTTGGGQFGVLAGDA